MTAIEFADKYRPILLGLFTEAWGLRNLKPSDYGMIVDQQMSRLKWMLEQMHRDLTEPAPKNGPAQPPRKP